MRRSFTPFALGSLLALALPVVVALAVRTGVAVARHEICRPE